MAMSNYNSMDEEEKQMTNQTDNDIALDVIDSKDFFPHNPFSENFDANFWEAVSEAYQDGNAGKNWATTLSQIRTNFLIELYAEKGDIIVGLMTDVYDKFYAEAKEKNQLELMPSFIQQISELVNIILNKDFQEAQRSGKKSKYAKLLECGGTKMTALHLVCDRNLVQIARHIVSLYPGQCYIKSSGGGLAKRVPLEMALENKMDETAAMLIKSMLNDRVLQLFQFDEALGRVKFSFNQLTGDVNMKQTVLAVLDCLINPDFPYVPVKPGEDKDVAWSKIPDLPMRYHINYQLLDGDDNGRPAKTKDLTAGEFVRNKAFNHLSPSGLYLIANSPFNDDIIGHPAVRLLVHRKWEAFGQRQSRLLLLFYLVYLLLMSLAFFLGVKGNDRSVYKSLLDGVRAACEIATLMISFVYVISEFDQMFKEGKQYWKDFYNYLDLVGLLLVISLLPIKWSTVDAISGNPSSVEWSVAAVAYLINFLRILKYFTAFKQIGIYAKTFAKILYYDISKFLLLSAVVLWAFVGSVYLSLKSTSDGLSKPGLNSWTVFLQEVRALSEGKEFSEIYAGLFSVGVIILLTINMFIIIVILTNILIGQLSYRYETALANARIQFDVDKAKIVTRLENSRFLKWNIRINNYQDGAYITEAAVVTQLLEDWDTIVYARKETNTGRESVRAMMEKMMKKQQ